MKYLFKHCKAKLRSSKLAVLAVLGIFLLTLTGCTAVQISASILFKEDGSGSRTITASIAKNDHQDGYGSAYYYLSAHGSELETYLKTVYTQNVSGSEGWLSIAVDDSGADWEVINLTFDFSSFEDYKTKLAALAFDEEAAAAYAAPELTANEDGTVTYTENTAVLTAIFKSIQLTLMEDTAVFDINSTKDGTALNDGSADMQSLKDSGVELMKPEFGNSMVVQIGAGEAAPVEAADGVYTVTGSYAGGELPKEEHVMTNVLNYGFNGDLSNKGTAAENDLTYGIGSTDGGPVFVEGIDGQAIQLDGNTYLASPNKSYNYAEMTLSFYYKMSAYTETDTGANMIIVPAGLGALGGGAIDIEFIKDGDVEGIQLLAKMNSADWQTQDKLYSEGYFMEAHLDEWHNYTIVFQNEYDEHGNINDAFVYMYIDGQVAAKARLAVAAGLTYSLGLYDDGAYGEPNGGFNVGGYMEAEMVKRACTGVIDNLMVFDGALTQEEVNSLCYTIAVEQPYDPNAVDTADQGQAAATEAPTAVPTATAAPAAEKEASEGRNPVIAAVLVIVVIGLVAAAGIYFAKKKK
ncbi:hypothetical protein HNQ56_001071 [Anaerotaenia torta]|uniref:LamG-like jellyroll fold domain-containing protein n=1 Tax=Anaerotaenia torta TaxID=433293 RepID=UPI003D1A9276